MTFEGFKDDQFHVLACFIRKNLAFKYTMYLNDTLYQSQVISTIFEMSQSESLHHFWWEFPPASLQSLGFPLSYLKCLQMGEGGGSRPLLENVQKEAAFSSVWLPLVDQRFVINATGLLRLIFLTSLYLILWNYSTVSIFCCCVCVWECQQNPGMNFYYLYIAEIVGHMELVDSKPLPKLHKWIC